MIYGQRIAVSASKSDFRVFASIFWIMTLPKLVPSSSSANVCWWCIYLCLMDYFSCAHHIYKTSKCVNDPKDRKKLKSAWISLRNLKMAATRTCRLLWAISSSLHSSLTKKPAFYVSTRIVGTNRAWQGLCSRQPSGTATYSFIRFRAAVLMY